MQHCIGSYADAAVMGDSYLFHIEYEGESASAEVLNSGVVRLSLPRNSRTVCLPSTVVKVSSNSVALASTFTCFDILESVRESPASRSNPNSDRRERQMFSPSQHPPGRPRIQSRTSAVPSVCTVLRPSSGIAMAGSECSIR